VIPNTDHVLLSISYSAQGFNQSVGVFVYNVSATDADIGTNSQIRYSLTGRFSEFFTIGRSSGSIFVSNLGVDFEALNGNPLIVLSVIATDQGLIHNGLNN